MELIERICNYLKANGVTVDLSANDLPTSPDEAVALTDTGGYRPERQSTTIYPTVQVMSRAGDYPTAKANARQIYDLLHDKENLVIDTDTTLCSVAATQEPSYMGKDSNQRILVVSNYIITMRR